MWGHEVEITASYFFIGLSNTTFVGFEITINYCSNAETLFFCWCKVLADRKNKYKYCYQE